MKKKLTLLKLRRISLYSLFLSIPICFLTGIFNSFGLLIIGVGLLLFYNGISLFIWKCPYCEKRLPMRFNSKNPEEYFCPYCNGNLLDKE